MAIQFPVAYNLWNSNNFLTNQELGTLYTVLKRSILMEDKQVSRTAQLTAIYRAYHSIHDYPKIFNLD